MKKLALISTLACCSLILFNPLLDAARGGGGGGGRGGGGGGGRGGGGNRGGGAVNRSPSMSRATQSPSNISRNTNVSRNTPRPSRSDINNRIQQTPRNSQDFTRAGNLGSNQERLNNALSDRKTRDLSNTNIGDNIRHDIGNQLPNRGDWFNDRFNNEHGILDHVGEGNAWKWASWGALTGWYNWGWNAPYYYDYGGYDDQNYVYSDQTQTISSASNQPAPSGDSLSLGVFTLTTAETSDVTPHIFMHLSLDKNGNIDGTLYNSTTNQAYPLEGIVDKTNQRAAWMMSDSENSPIIETGIYNLTQDQTPARLIFADGTSKNIILVRVKQ